MSQNQQSFCPTSDSGELQSQPMDLAQKPVASSASSAPSVPQRLIADAAKSIFLVKQAGSPGPLIAGSGVTVATSPTPSTAGNHQGPIAVSLPVPIAMAKIQTAVRPGSTVSLAPRVIPTTLVAASGAYPNLQPVPVSHIGLHVPKGPAAVASIAIPRSAVATAAAVRPGTSTAVAQVAGFPVVNRAPKPPARPTSLDVGTTGALSGTWVTVTPSPTQTVNTAATSTVISKPSGTLGAVKNTTNLILTSAVQKSPLLTTTTNASTVSIIGQSKAASGSSSITLVSVRGTPANVARPTVPSAVAVNPRPELIKTSNTLLQPAPYRAPSSMTITSQAKSCPVSTTGVRPPSTGQIHIAARAVSQAAGPPTSSSPRIEVSSVKNANPTPAAKANQMQLPQMSVTAVASKLAPHVPLMSRMVPSTGTVPVGALGRTYLVTTQAPSPSVIPVAKVLPQSSSSLSAAPVTTLRAVDLSTGPVVCSSGDTTATSTAAGFYLRTTAATSSTASADPLHTVQSNTPSKMGTSPRPSILRKRDYDGGVTLKAQKNLSATLALMTSTAPTGILSQAAPSTSPPSPRRIDSVSGPTGGGGGGDSSRSSSGGSTTLSASSSPGIPADIDEAPAQTSLNIVTSSVSAILGKALTNIQVKQEAAENAETSGAVASLMKMGASTAHMPNMEMSPRKKPRKQQLHGQELQEVRSSDEEVHQVSAKEVKNEVPIKSEPKEVVTVLKRPRVTLMSSYRQTWKSRSQHFMRYSDVKLKDERRPTVTDLANQKQVMKKVHGWKIYHLSAQIEDMAFSESQVHDRLCAILENMEKLGFGKGMDRDMMRVNELIKGNLQRSKVIQDGLNDSKNQVQKLFEHKPRAEEIIHRYMFKRLAKKRDKS